MRNVGSGHSSAAIEAPGAVAAVFALVLMAGFGVANGCGKQQEPVLQGKDTQSPSVKPAVMSDAPLSGPQIIP